MKILITVPHSFCIKNSRHVCDYLADDASLNLYKNFRKLNKVTYRILSNKNRSLIDYNRKISRNYKWRVFVRKIIINEMINLLLDIHSFPNKYISFGYIKNTKIIPEIVILDSYHNNYKFLDYVTSINFNKYLLKNGILSKLMFGGENDITIEAREYGKRSVLIEYNESLSKKRLNFINKVIINYYKQYT